MKVSIVMPTLNEEKLISKSLESLRNQNCDYDIELIIVDSYSKDRTLKIAKNYADQILFTPPGIIAAAREKGSRAATGEVIVSSGADNIYNSRWLSELIKPIESGKAIASAGRLIPKNANALERIFSSAFLSPFSGFSLSLGIPLVAGESMAFLKSSYQKAGGFRTDLVTGEDINLIKRFMDLGEVSYCPDSIAYVSTRRIREWGYAKYLWFHGSNFIRMNLTGKTHSIYEPVR